MTASTTHISTKYQIVIPKKVREKMKLSPRETLLIFMADQNTLILKKAPKSIFDLPKIKFPKDYLKNERLSWD